MNSRAKQQRFSGSEFKAQDVFGGTLLKKKSNRTARPLSTKHSLHLILKSSRAKAELSFRAPAHRQRIAGIIRRAALKNGVKLIRCSNNFNHLHLHLKISSREAYKRFIRAISGAIAMAVTGAGKTRPFAGKFWEQRPYSRIVRGWRGFKTADDYVALNQLEAEGLIPKRDSRLKGLRPDERRYFERVDERPTSTHSQTSFRI